MPSAIELFSGCGGLSTGLIAAGFEVLSAVEINQTAADTYGLNHPTVNLIVDDVRNVTAVSLLRRHNLRIGELDLLAGCSPCQGFSRLRKGESGSTDPRNQLVLEFLRLVRGLRPKTVFMENVPGLITTEYGEKLFKERIRKIPLKSMISEGFWSEWRGSNSRPRGPKPRVLSAELHPDIQFLP